MAFRLRPPTEVRTVTSNARRQHYRCLRHCEPPSVADGRNPQESSQKLLTSLLGTSGPSLHFMLQGSSASLYREGSVPLGQGWRALLQLGSRPDLAWQVFILVGRGAPRQQEGPGRAQMSSRSSRFSRGRQTTAPKKNQFTWEVLPHFSHRDCTYGILREEK